MKYRDYNEKNIVKITVRACEIFFPHQNNLNPEHKQQRYRKILQQSNSVHKQV